MNRVVIVSASLFTLLIAACSSPSDRSASGNDLLTAEKDKDKDKDGCDPSDGGTPDTNPGDCTRTTQGSDSSCKPIEIWKSYAAADCESQGKVLNDYAVAVDCGGGSYRYVSYTCCGAVDAGPAPDTGPVDDGSVDTDPAPDTAPVDDGSVDAGPACIGAEQGDPTSCKSVDTWKSYASADCASTGRVLSEYTVSDECGPGLYRHVKYTCCAAPPPPDAGSACPANPTDWAIGTPCKEPLVCDYKDACGNIDQFHCKYGQWQINTWTYCPGKSY